MATARQPAHDWSRRATGREFIDDPDSLPAADTALVLAELEIVNRWLGCAAYRRWLRRAICSVYEAGGDPVSVLDVGAGGGDIALSTIRWCRARSIPTRWVLVDFSLKVCTYAREKTGAWPEIEVAQADVGQLPLPDRSIDVVTCAAFLHHFADRELLSILARMGRVRRHWLVFNDLHRNRLAAWSISLLTTLLSKSPAIRHDGPLSVRRGFRRAELETLLAAAGIAQVRIGWRWPFRWCARAGSRTLTC